MIRKILFGATCIIAGSVLSLTAFINLKDTGAVQYMGAATKVNSLYSSHSDYRIARWHSYDGLDLRFIPSFNLHIEQTFKNPDAPDSGWGLTSSININSKWTGTTKLYNYDNEVADVLTEDASSYKFHSHTPSSDGLGGFADYGLGKIYIVYTEKTQWFQIIMDFGVGKEVPPDLNNWNFSCNWESKIRQSDNKIVDLSIPLYDYNSNPIVDGKNIYSDKNAPIFAHIKNNVKKAFFGATIDKDNPKLFNENHHWNDEQTSPLANPVINPPALETTGGMYISDITDFDSHGLKTASVDGVFSSNFDFGERFKASDLPFDNYPSKNMDLGLNTDTAFTNNDWSFSNAMLAKNPQNNYLSRQSMNDSISLILSGLLPKYYNNFNNGQNNDHIYDAGSRLADSFFSYIGLNYNLYHDSKESLLGIFGDIAKFVNMMSGVLDPPDIASAATEALNAGVTVAHTLEDDKLNQRAKNVESEANRTTGSSIQLTPQFWGYDPQSETTHKGVYQEFIDNGVFGDMSQYSALTCLDSSLSVSGLKTRTSDVEHATRWSYAWKHDADWEIDTSNAKVMLNLELMLH